jgi:excisionase family DNA binding protein
MADTDLAAVPGDGGTADEAEAAQRARRQRVAALKQELVGGDLLTAAEVGEILDIHPRTVGEYIRDGKLRAFQFGGGWKISELALRAFVREQTQGSGSPAGPAGARHPIARALDDALMTLLPEPAEPAAGEPRRPAGRGRGAYRCSFCGKAQEDVRRLIAGPNLIFICDDCVGLCNRILAGEEVRATEGAQPPAGGAPPASAGTLNPAGAPAVAPAAPRT